MTKKKERKKPKKMSVSLLYSCCYKSTLLSMNYNCIASFFHGENYYADHLLYSREITLSGDHGMTEKKNQNF